MATVDLVLPVYNEETILARSVARVQQWCAAHPEHRWRIVIADNASVDATLTIARSLEARSAGAAGAETPVVALYLPVKGRGFALRAAWLTSDAEVLAYMDVDLSTDLQHLPALIDPVAAGEIDLAYGTRLAAGAEVERQWRRELLSRGYIGLLQRVTGLRATDAQCGFKAITRPAARALLPRTTDGHWFFDTELLLLAQRGGYRLREVPVRWVEDRDSRVQIVQTVREDLRGAWRMRALGNRDH